MHPKDSDKEKKNQWIKFIGLLSSVIIGLVILISLVHKNNSVSEVKKEDKLKLETPMLHVNDGIYILEKAQKRAAEAEKRAWELSKKIDDINQTQIKIVEEFQQRINVLEKNSEVRRQ